MSPAVPDDPWGIAAYDVDAYLDQVGVRSGPPDLDLLGALCSAHVRTLPFANVDVLLASHPGVAPEQVNDQLVHRHRGGYCFEHAQLFAAVAERLGFEVRRRLGRVYSLESPRTHMSVEVRLEGRRWLCDPGFGLSMTGPIEISDGATRDELEHSFTMHRGEDAATVVWELRRDGETLHFTEEATVHPADVAAGHFVTSRSPDSIFTGHLTVIRHLGDTHVTVTETHRTVRAARLPTTFEPISVDEVIDGVRELGIVLGGDDVDRLVARVTDIRSPTQS